MTFPPSPRPGRRPAPTRAALAVLAVLAAATASAAPVAAPPSTPRRVAAAARDLVLTRADLPVDASMANDEAVSEHEHAAAFFRPEVLLAPVLPQGEVLGIIAGVVVLKDAAAADREFSERGSVDPTGLAAELVAAGSSLPPSVTAVTSGLPDGLDRAVAFRAEYALRGVQVVEYRYRMQVGNALANLIVTSRAGDRGREGAAVAGQARTLAERQARRLLAAVVAPGVGETGAGEPGAGKPGAGERGTTGTAGSAGAPPASP